MSARGALVTVALPGAYGKPRPALIVQNNVLHALDSVVLCPITSEVHEALFRVTVEPSDMNGLKAVSQVMVDKLMTLPRHKVGPPFGQLEEVRMRAVDRALLLVIGVI